MRTRVPHPLYFREALAEYERIGYLDYDACVRRLEKVFGREHIIIRPYDRSRFIEGNLIKDFFHVCSLSWKNEYVTSHEANSSNTLAVSYALAVTNKSYFASGKRPPIFRFKSSKLYSQRYPEREKTHALDLQERQTLMKKYADGNHWISQEYLDGQPLFGAALEKCRVLRPHPVRDRWTVHKIHRFEQQLLRAEGKANGITFLHRVKTALQLRLHR